MFKKNEIVLLTFADNQILGIVVKQIHQFYVVNLIGGYRNLYMTERVMSKITSKIKIKEVNGGQIICG
jgi:hypothetical protein